MENQIKNIAGYQFIVIDDVATEYKQVQAICDQTHLKGTVFISPEGINLNLAGNDSDIDFAIGQLKTKCGFDNLLINTTYSEAIPFKRLLVKTRDELVPTKSNLKYNGDLPYITSEELKHWLDNNIEVTLLDLRNGFEYELGSFKHARHLDLKHFRELENANTQLEVFQKDKPVVTFCTGGIRCEKGAAFIQQQGFENVYQLKGGILDYLAKFKGQHWQGNCFVFDDRISLDAELNPTYANLCRSCQTILQNNEENFCLTCSGLT